MISEKTYKGFNIKVEEIEDVTSSIIYQSTFSLAFSVYADGITTEEAIKDCIWTVDDYLNNPDDYEEMFI